jgi:hypothetical protein
MTNVLKPVTLPATRPSLQELEPRAQRQANALDDIRQMHEDLQQQSLELSKCYRELDARQNKIDLLTEELAKAQDSEKVYRRKLIRLAAHQEQVGKIAQLLYSLAEQSVAIMKDARELDDVATEREAATETGGTDG